MNGVLVPAAWDIINLLTNGKTMAQTIGAGFISLLGIIAVVVAVVFALVKLLSESRRSWLTIIVLFLFGGLALTGGIALFVNIASGAQTTVEQLGTGVILLGLAG